MEHQTHVLILIKQLVILIRSLMKRELHNFRNAFISVDIITIWSYGAEILKNINDSHKMLTTLDEKLKFMIEIGGSSICFLDLKMFIEGNRLVTTA